jgi:hypothetical protein
MLGPGDIDRRATNAQFWCPFCKHPDAKKRKLAVRLEDGVTHCWVCNWSARSPLRLVPVVGADRELREKLTEIFGDVGAVEGDEPVVEEVVAELPSDFTLVCDEIDRGVRHPDKLASIRYLEKRGVTYNAAKYFRLGLSNQSVFRRRVIFPSFDGNGSLNYVTARAVDDDTTFKYFNTQTQRSNLVFNEVDVAWNRELVLVEGPFDLLACVGMNAVAMLGSWLDENYLLFNRIVANRTPVVLAFDPDATKKQEKVARRLLQYEIPIRVVDWSEHASDVDPAKVGHEAFKSMVKLASHYDQTSAFRSRLTRTLDTMRLS